MSDEEKQLLEKQLWAVANQLRGSMNADEYRNYILGFIFYKYLSEKMMLYASQGTMQRINESASQVFLGLFLSLWLVIICKGHIVMTSEAMRPIKLFGAFNSDR